MGKSEPIWFRNLQNLKFRCVCESCNHGWMSTLENESKPILNPLLHDVPAPLAAAEQAIVARWAMKTAMVFEAIAPGPFGNERFYTRDECEQLRVASGLPARTAVWLGRFSGNFIGGGASHIGGTQFRHNEVAVRKVHGHVTTVVVNHLTIQVLTIHIFPEDYAPFVNIPQNNAPCDWDDLALPIWPNLRAVEWPPKRSCVEDGPFRLGTLVGRFKTGRKI
jgi:hypothetical protein